jgi:hypothetical protein
MAAFDPLQTLGRSCIFAFVKRARPVLFGLTLTLIGCAQPAPNPTICQLARNRDLYAGQTVTVEGLLLVSHHGSALIGSDCGEGIGLSWFAEDVPGMRDFDAAAARSLQRRTLVRARVTGKVKREEHGQFGLPPALTLSLASADVLEERPISELEHKRFLDWIGGPHHEPFKLGQ